MPEQLATEFLGRIGYGVLATPGPDQPYAFPVSFGYDHDSTLYFQFGWIDYSKKMAAIESADRASFVAYDVRPPEWQSVVVTGSIGPVPGDKQKRAYDAHRGNAWVPTNAFDSPLAEVEFEFYELEVETVTGYGTQMLDRSERD